ncbi:hypothetical protein DFH07DRAFT_734377, partial [Mycena maculata]
MAEHVARLRNLWKVANDMGAKIEDGQFRTIFISLLGEEWDNVVPVLHTYKTSAEVISFVTMHAERLNRTGVPSTSTPAPQALAANTNFDTRRAARKNLTCTNAQCGAPGKKGHTIDNCFWPGGGKQGQWPTWWKGKQGPAVAPAANTNANTVETFAFSVWTIPEAFIHPYDADGIQAVHFRGEEVLASPESFMAWEEAAEATIASTLPDATTTASESSGFEVLDTTSSEFEFVSDISSVVSGDDTDTDDEMPVLQSINDLDAYHGFDFTSRRPSRLGSKFRILGTGVVRKVIMHQGQKKELALNALHTPDITVHLISISKLDASGYSVEFGQGKAVFKKPDGSPFMAGALVSGMY